MPVVLDSSMSVALVMDDEAVPDAELLIDLMVVEGIVAPTLWRFEAGNALLVAARRGRIDWDDCLSRLRLLLSLPIEFDSVSGAQLALDTMALAKIHGLTVYDGAYVELARRTSAVLATLDDRMARAAGAEGVEVIGG
jgi:predicted nucleic acid-binding protein